jgi:hypothetical protein
MPESLRRINGKKGPIATLDRSDCGDHQNDEFDRSCGTPSDLVSRQRAAEAHKVFPVELSVLRRLIWLNFMPWE